MRPQTIQIFLPPGDLRGMRVAEITTRIVRVIEVPRSQLADFLKMPEAQQVGVYFLIGESICKGSSANGVGEYTTEGFVVLKDSKGRIENVASIQGTSNVQIREALVKDGVMAPQDGLYVFTRSHLFPSPSQAAMALMGRSANGWVEWKAANGKTLDELKRQTVAAVG